MRCAKCGAENPAGKRFCGDCGAPLANRCRQWGAENSFEKKFCGDCGSALGTAMTAALAPSWEFPRFSGSLEGEKARMIAKIFGVFAENQETPGLAGGRVGRWRGPGVE
jgi:hypothetical protein